MPNPVKGIFLGIALVALLYGCSTSRDSSSRHSRAGTGAGDEVSVTANTQAAPGQPRSAPEEVQMASADRAHKGLSSRDRRNARREANARRKFAAEKRQREAQAARQVMGSGYIYPNSPNVYAPPTDPGRETYAHVKENDVKTTADEPVSTFSIDVDTGSYANVRRFLNNGTLPPQDAVRVEELINYFDYDYPIPAEDEAPFSVSTELTTTPWNRDTWLLQVGLKGYEINAAERPPTNLVFLIDVSGSMRSSDKLPLLKKSFKLLTRKLNSDDRISMVVYAGASGVVLEPTPGNKRRTILRALSRLRAGGSTNGAAGIELAYNLAEEAFIEGGINRIILATDGDFNVGTVNFEELVDLAERKRESGVSLTTLGFGSGNYNDQLIEQLADAGNGNYAYIDSAREARKVLVREVSSTLMTIAKDVKIQIEFNPDIVAEYRLIGYENRALNREDFKNDKVDAGEIGAGHTVTALYELTPVNSKARLVDPLRYGTVAKTTGLPASNEVAFLKLRYKEPDAQISDELTYPVHRSQLTRASKASNNIRFAAAVSAFGQMLKGSDYTGVYDFEDVYDLASNAITSDRHGYRAEFLGLVESADELMNLNAHLDNNEGAIAVSD